jgi:hypothetical protein
MAYSFDLERCDPLRLTGSSQKPPGMIVTTDIAPFFRLRLSSDCAFLQEGPGNCFIAFS